ncbi:MULTISPECIES: Fur family transcriptional regulator [Clostridium]|uniref:Ferric uptake regulation protein n=2 Tax=Clostridium TaxID=1485 RepID=A0A151AK22_9CLOT|nr:MULTISPECIES: Fur family transcriptional regulator [Clostridium]KYH27983.1 ferric uptake regulation protein [Clostridium colicanis DSM 13634]MBE6045062.1 transcriptional repressor [Clostridium thermopalmarium]PRR71621.1 Ferric uptake regulation protein [Clostridium thermopalmarium DSM 5974]PVZ19406.1 Fur family zinc uptake transcriptional regulator/Fur family ferric uptake transcriptional regulator [Clostridium thermopalmarium DSM 5974]
MINIDEIEEALKKKGYKLTRQRKSILEVLIENSGKLISVEDIYIQCKKKYSKTNLSTVYRNLEILKDIGMLHKTNFNGSSSSYEITYNQCHHHHLICKNCGKTETIDYCPLEAITPKINNNGFTVTDHRLEIYGYCSNCSKNNKS